MSLSQIRSDWTQLGASDPLWAVLVSPEHRHGRWREDEFFQTGLAEATEAMAHARRLDLHPGSERALDFGCGAGRLTSALTSFAGHVVGVDISPTMLAKARELDTTGRIEFLENNRGDLSIFEDNSFDLVYSSLVLQHIPTALSLTYLAEMLRVLKNDGLLIVQIAEAPDRSARGWLTRLTPRSALRFAQRRLLGYPAPIDMHSIRRDQIEVVAAKTGSVIVDTAEVPMYGGHWRYVRYYLAFR